MRGVRLAVAGMMLTAITPALLPSQAATTSVLLAPGPEYGAGGLYRFFFGANYRQLWTRPVRIPVLDLATFDGGLRPTRRGGGMQTKSLRFQSSTGREYAFRSVNKDPSAILPAELKGTLVQAVVQDQISAGHPFSALVADVFADAANAPRLHPHLVVLPDDPALGEFRADFAGKVGYLEDRPDDGPGRTAGFAGFIDVLSTEEMLKRRREHPEEVVDVPAFLAARLIDLFLGDWDRHRGQWRWGRVSKSVRWTPVPRDRDQAFASYGGLLLSIARQSAAPQLVKFGEGPIPVTGLSWNGRDLDRELLPRLDRAVWDSVTAAVTSRLTDDLIDTAVAALPAEVPPSAAARLRLQLRARRDALPRASTGFYRRLSRDADIHATDAAEHFTLRGDSDGTVLLESGGDQAGTRIQRRFRASETGEIRLYTHGGADTVTRTGPTNGIKVRMIGGKGHDAATGPVRFYEGGADWRPLPDESSSPPPRDWGSRTGFMPFAGFATDIGFVAGGTLTVFDYGFRKEPYASKVTTKVAFSTGSGRPGLDLDADFRTENPLLGYRLGVRATGLEMLRFYGLGNETVESNALEYYRVPHWLVELTPSLQFHPSPRLALGLGPLLRYVDAPSSGNRLIAVQAPYGTDGFGEAGVQGTLRWDSRDVPANPRSGAMLELGGELMPAVWDVASTFGSVHGEASTAIGFGGEGTPVLALRAGGRRVFGDYPFFEGATVGGAGTVRGYAEQRFRGDGAVYGSAELRVPVAQVQVIVPARFGVFGLADAGRVFLEGESSDTWHHAFGGGFWLAWLGRPNTLSVAVARSPDKTGVYVRAGFLF